MNEKDRKRRRFWIVFTCVNYTLLVLSLMGVVMTMSHEVVYENIRVWHVVFCWIIGITFPVAVWLSSTTLYYYLVRYVEQCEILREVSSRR